MKRNTVVFILTAASALFLTACGWNPSVTEVPITAPWDKMNLPIKEDARVWASDDKILKVAHKARRRDVAQRYLEALEKDGWKLTAQPDVREHGITFDFEKGGQKIDVNVTDAENTAVIIEKR